MESGEDLRHELLLSDTDLVFLSVRLAGQSWRLAAQLVAARTGSAAVKSVLF